MTQVLVTGAAGLIGSAIVRFYSERDAVVTGIDNDLRGTLLGVSASTASVVTMLRKTYPDYRHLTLDVRDAPAMERLLQNEPFDLIVHAAGQPSHEWAASNPLEDFSINATGTLQLLEWTRQYQPQAVFVLLSTNKVYGDTPNALPLVEHATRWDLPSDHPQYDGIDEAMSIDQSMHSIFGASKLSADILTQEYGRYFGVKTAVLRCSCITGGMQTGTMMHGFLSHLVRSVVHGKTYAIIGHGGKQVRDNLHADDIASAVDAFHSNPRPGAVYNMGGGRSRSVSVLEALERTAAITDRTPVTHIEKTPRKGDHLWYITSTAAFQQEYPSWKPTLTLDAMIEDIAHHATVVKTPKTRTRALATR